ncbi:hypothetical protein KAFR_0B03850 [Kazachstania africana CBS 2517]|uniref:Ceramide very long chain fatty acid hydroxylase n=1 Tax=Kazachstania africana (strain ATCC 22294 / BCRC 22015 / CBS 2517 / CECT 1963 / NBRC 1671 / NRRL Y-8276) TaxID=1071382 RepID=H2AQN1_KAZAF|nr:hypothetical protein KAFR_0B03850 [Kazachstania africana CBS 2517]CCF56681.1 hypothetical protein KAFR_0B03850 [Kazachstania africana CBS 2517]
MTTAKTLELFSKKEVANHTKREDCWVTIFSRKIYDVTKFLDENRDFDSLLLDYAGTDITDELVNGKLDEKYKALDNDNYLVGYVATADEEQKLLTNKDHKVEVTLEQDFDLATLVVELPPEEKLTIATNYDRDFKKHKFLDLNKPLLPQILKGKFTREFYVDQINRPRHYGQKSAPLFGNAFLEPFSKTAWWVVPTFWLPVVFHFFRVALKNMNNPLALFLFCVGVFVWTLLEYCLHRFLFHFDNYLPENNIAFALHFLLHGFHHYLPMDPYRLVVPPALFIILCAPIYKTVFLLLPYYWACAGFAGGLFGYVYYDMCHYALHHSKLPPFMRRLKQYHLEHHYKNYELGYGITSWFWDKVFGTYLSKDAPASVMKFD